MKNLVTALVKFQASVPAIPKNKKNPFFNSMYAELSTVIDVCAPVLNSHGLAISQLMSVSEGNNILTTMLLHESGESLSSSLMLPNLADAQKLTAAITYLRRSQYLAIIGLVAEDDDDGNAVGEAKKYEPSRPAPKPASVSPANAGTPASDASEAQLRALDKMGIKYTLPISKSYASDLIKNSNNKR